MAPMAPFSVAALREHIVMWGFNKYLACHMTNKPATLASSHAKKLESSPVPEQTLGAMLGLLTNGLESPNKACCGCILKHIDLSRDVPCSGW